MRTKSHFLSIFVGNNMVNETEFVTFWRMHTGDNKDRAEAFFSLFDITGNGEFGDQVEKDAFFTGFDYDSKFTCCALFINLLFYANNLPRMENS